jgi:polysaccharide biosynthesis transport protein
MSDVSDLNRHTETTSDTGVVAPAAIEPTSYEAPGILYAGEERKSGLLMEYLRTLGRYRWLIAACGVCGILASFLMSFSELPVYRARTSLDIQSLNNDFMNMKAVAPTDNAMDPASDEYVQTQIKLLQSQTLLDRTTKHLLADPHPEFVDKMDLASQLERALYLAPYKRIPYEELVNDTSKHITVKPLGITRLVEITCDSWSSEVSADFCNTLVEQFKAGDLEMREAESTKTSDWLTKQVADVKVKEQESEKALKAATGGNGFILNQESTGVEEDRLRSMQSEYVRAEADRMQKEAAAGIGSASAAGMDPNLEASPEYSHATEKLSDLQGQLAALGPNLTDDNDRVIKLHAQIKNAEKAMADVRAANQARLKSDYEAAQHREAMLANAYHAEESRVSSDLGKASDINMLRGEVESEQKLYATLMGLAREAGLASAIHASTVRVVDAATAVKIPFSPRRSSAAGSGLLFGTLCGVGLAFFIDRSSTVFRVPGDIERYLGLRELGVIPSSLRGHKARALPTPDASGAAQVITPKEAQPALSNWTENFSIIAEAYRSATTSIMLSEHPREHGRIYVLSSANAGEGKTTVTSNLGVALSKSRLRVLLVDGDLRKPALHKVLQVPNEFGLRNLLRGETRPNLESGEPSTEPCYQPTSLPNLFVLPSGQGSEEVTELLHSTQTGELLKRLRNDFDVVIIDTPPMLHMADTRILASHAQGAILVVRAGLTTRDEAAKARDLFDQDRVRMVGTILNDFNPDRNGLPNYYKSYYRYMEDVSTAAGGTLSWLEGLFSREPKTPRRTSAARSGGNGSTGFDGFDGSDASSFEDVEFDEADARDFGNVTAAAARAHATQSRALVKRPNGGIVRVARAAANGSGGGSSLVHSPVGRDLMVSQLFTNKFDRAPMTISSIESGAPDAMDSMDDSVFSEEPEVLYVEERTEERRRTARQEYPQLVAYYWDGGAPCAHFIRDISLTGFYLFTEERWYPGTQVMILLQRADDGEDTPERSITVNARVVRFGVDGIGFAFVTPDKKSSRGGDNYSTGADRNTFYRFLQRLPENEG